MKLFSHKKRPVHLGPYPLERLPRVDDPNKATSSAGSRRLSETRREGPHGLSHAYQTYFDMYDAQRHGEPSEAGPIPDDPIARAEHIKAGLYFLDADMVGCGVVPTQAWSGDAPAGHEHAIVVLVAHTRTVGESQPGDEWIDGTRQINADLRAAELASTTAQYIRRLGFDATAHTPTATEADIEHLALQCGLVERRRGVLCAPFIKSGLHLLLSPPL